MKKELEIDIESNHIETLTKSSGSNAIIEMIWNSLDADSTEIEISSNKNVLDTYSSLLYSDNGHGINYNVALNILNKIGGTEKKSNYKSPKQRPFHGKQGKGRYKMFSLGNFIEINSTYKEDNKYFQYIITLDHTNLKKITVFERKLVNDTITGTEIKISNINSESVNQSLSKDSITTYLQTFVNYNFKYPFTLKINKESLNFNELIYDKANSQFTLLLNDINRNFNVTLIRWANSNITSKTFLCNNDNLPLEERQSLMRKLPYSLSVFIASDYIEELHKSGMLQLDDFNNGFDSIKKEVHKIIKEFNYSQLQQHASEYIDELKRSKIYPYKNKPENNIEESERKIFDVIALTLHNSWHNFDEQDERSKKSILTLIKHSLETNPTNLKKILKEVIELPLDKQKELSDLLDEISLVNIIDSTKIINDRLTFIQGLRLIIFDTVINKKVLERIHLHKILEKETWIFGDEYTLGASDNSLRNVLNKYLEYLERENLVDDLPQKKVGNDGKNLNKIPDICLWKQKRLNYGKDLHNLVIELKRPNLVAGIKELNQIENYAQFVSTDNSFDRLKTKWTFVLLVQDIKANEVSNKMNQEGREYGHIVSSGNINVYVKTWSQVLNDAESKHEFLKEKLNITWEDNSKIKDYLKKVYSQYLPDIFNEN